jgi:hypothetical protein
MESYAKIVRVDGPSGRLRFSIFSLIRFRRLLLCCCFWVFCNLPEERDEVLDSNQVSVLVVADLPGRLVVNVEPLGNGDSLAKVNEPDGSLVRVVDKQQRAANQLKKKEMLEDTLLMGDFYQVHVFF